MEREDMVQCDADGISGIALIGSPGGSGSEGGKRRAYFEKAAAGAGIPVSFYDWKDFPWGEKAGGMGHSIVKIDAPEWKSFRLCEMEALTGQYGERLRQLSRMPVGAFFNHPSAVAAVLDKRGCKKRLMENGVAVTEMYEESFSCGEELFGFLRENRVHQVFIKPVQGSGAAGVTALRFSPGTGKRVLYTCAAPDRGGLVNTKKLHRLEGEAASAFLDQLFTMDCIVEKWYGKAVFHDYFYDLRVIVQGGRIDYILPRLSKGPITNLHLNNHSMEFAELYLDGAVSERIGEECLRAAACYPGLKSIGMDVLLEKGSLRPRIIELNGQGDLLHRDVYGGNRIYRRQVEIMRAMMAEGKYIG